eukprot:14542316-Alexandrium_andersonii.AAC.1
MGLLLLPGRVRVEEGAAPPRTCSQVRQYGRRSVVLYWMPATVLISACRARKGVRLKTARKSQSRRG